MLSGSGLYSVTEMSDVTRILQSIEQGDPNAAEELLPLVYDELRKLAAARMAHEAPGQTLQATALVHEAWLRLTGSNRQQWHGRAHFFGAAAEAMRRILIDKARRKASQKRAPFRASFSAGVGLSAEIFSITAWIGRVSARRATSSQARSNFVLMSFGSRTSKRSIASPACWYSRKKQ